MTCQCSVVEISDANDLLSMTTLWSPQGNQQVTLPAERGDESENHSAE